MIRSPIMEIPSTRGQDGTPIPVFGMAARTCPLGWVLESATSEVLDGAGITGDSIGMADSQLLAAAGTTPEATRFIIGTASIGAGWGAAERPTVAASTKVGAGAAERPTVAVSTKVGARAADLPAVPAPGPRPSTETPGLREDTVHPAVRAASARAPSATSRGVDKQGAIRHAEAPALVAEHRVEAVLEDRAVGVVEEGMAAVAGVTNQSSVMFLVRL